MAGTSQLFERPQSGERAVLVHIDGLMGAAGGDLAEFRELVESAGAESVAVVQGQRRTPEAKYFIGSGKAKEVAAMVTEQAADLVILDHALSPSQERNLEALLRCRVLDRSGLILDIFAQRARSFEGKLQVELAQLRHLSTRLVRGWTHLERQKGGIGLRGPGETQLETDRRLLAQRIQQIERRLEKVDKQRDQGRRARRKTRTATVALVSYTNVGKSTLFNQLTRADSYAANQLFATLDPTLRRIQLPGGDRAVLADTVGFIRHLPHELVAAFRATLQETAEANLLLHVIDASDPEHGEAAAAVEQVLIDIGAADIATLRVYNKIDKLGKRAHRMDNAIWLSAVNGDGLELLSQTIAESLRGDDTIHAWLHLPMEQGRLRARLFDLQAVLNEHSQSQGSGWLLEVQTSRATLDRLRLREGLRQEWLQAIS